MKAFEHVLRSALGIALATGALACLPSRAGAQDVFISTSVQCKQWAAARAKRNAVNYEHYLQGFLDGYALGNKMDFWGAMEGTRLAPAQAFNRLDDYCQANPEGNLLGGAHKLFVDRQKELAAASITKDKKKR